VACGHNSKAGPLFKAILFADNQSLWQLRHGYLTRTGLRKSIKCCSGTYTLEQP
jgi:hypothetical protein